MSVILETSIGDITIDLYVKERPKCCLNFLKLCKVKYFNFNLFHSVQRNLVAQTGDPSGSGKGGESVYRMLYGEQAKYFEYENKPRIKHKSLGTVSMVNNGSNMHGSQFLITLRADIDYLDDQQHTVFGQVVEGHDVLKALNEAFVDTNSRPYKDIRIYHTVIIDDPFPDPPDLDSYIPARSPEPRKLDGDTVRIGVDEDIDDDNNLDAEEAQERTREREAHANAQILEMIGDLPSIDVKPPDNVLFVCKLNPVTTSEDLEVIFSRFGQIDSCEVIKDQKTEESLQYAFIEFKNVKDCESAYFKMDNTLIDDRRIHVDFSQSVSKIMWKGKGKNVPNQKNDNDDDRPQFRIRDPDLRADNAYDLVFDSDESTTKKSKVKKAKKVKKHKKHRDASTELASVNEPHTNRGKNSRQHSGSESPVRKIIQRPRSRTRSPHREIKSRQTDRSDGVGRDRRQRSRSRSPRKGVKSRRDSRSKSPDRRKIVRRLSRSSSPDLSRQSDRKKIDDRHVSKGDKNKGNSGEYVDKDTRRMDDKKEKKHDCDASRKEHGKRSRRSNSGDGQDYSMRSDKHYHKSSRDKLKHRTDHEERRKN